MSLGDSSPQGALALIMEDWKMRKTIRIYNFGAEWQLSQVFQPESTNQCFLLESDSTDGEGSSNQPPPPTKLPRERATLLHSPKNQSEMKAFWWPSNPFVRSSLAKVISPFEVWACLFYHRHEEAESLVPVPWKQRWTVEHPPALPASRRGCCLSLLCLHRSLFTPTLLFSTNSPVSTLCFAQQSDVLSTAALFPYPRQLGPVWKQQSLQAMEKNESFPSELTAAADN